MFVLVLIPNANGGRVSIGDGWCECSSLNLCDYSTNEPFHQCYIDDWKCFKAAQQDNCTGGTLTCIGAEDEFCGCKKWNCSNQQETETPGGTTITSCKLTINGTTLTGYKTDSDCAVGPVSNYYDSKTKCCVSRTISNSCGASYEVSRTSKFPENTFAHYGDSTSDTNELVTIKCAKGYYIDPVGGTPKANSITAKSGESVVRIQDCEGCSTEKCFPRTPYSCYTDGQTGCLTENLDINGDKTIDYNEKNIPFEWINCKKLDPSSCGYSSTDQFYTDFIAKNPDDTYKRQKFYVYSGNSCTIIWGNISCAQPGYWLDGSTCAPCPAGAHGISDALEYTSCDYCPNGKSTFDDTNADGKIEITEHFEAAPDSSYCNECPVGHMKTGNYCKPCENAGYYNSKTGQTSTDRKTSKCTEKCPIPFTTDTTDINDSINKCYIDSGSGNTAIKLTDSLGSIFLHEEIGTNVKLYHQ